MSGVVWLFGQMLIVPFRTLVYGMERLVDAMRDMQAAGSEGLQALSQGPEKTETRQEAPEPNLQDVAADSGAKESAEETQSMDTNLNDDKVKLVRYQILSIKRGDEKILIRDRDEIVTDNMDGAAFAAWKIAEYCNDLSLGNDDRKYLRVFYEVLHRYDREPLKYEEDQLKVLREIRDRIAPGVV